MFQVVISLNDMSVLQVTLSAVGEFFCSPVQVLGDKNRCFGYLKRIVWKS